MSKSPIKKSDIGKIELNIEEISIKLYERILKENNEKFIQGIWNLQEVKRLFKIEFKEDDWFIGDEDFFFYENENDEIEIGEFAKEELRDSTVCPKCKFNLLNKIKKIIIQKFKSQKENIQYNFQFSESQGGVLCPNCNLIIDKDKLTGRKIIGKFRIELPHVIFEYLSWKEIIGFFNNNGEDDFYIEHYQYP